MRVEKPLLGFGWMGWVLLAIAGALVVVWVTGYDLQYQVLATIHALFGDQVLWFISARFFAMHSFNAATTPPQTGFGLWGICAVCIAFWVYPRPLGWWRWLIPIAWGVIAPSVWWDMQRINHRGMQYIGSTDIMLTIIISLALMALIHWMILTLVTRSRTVAISIAVLGICTLVQPIAMNHYGLMSVPPWISKPSWYLAWAWNPILLAILLAWAIPARIRYNRWWLCSKCRYDLRDLDTTTCPECGMVNERIPATDTDAALTDS